MSGRNTSQCGAGEGGSIRHRESARCRCPAPRQQRPAHRRSSSLGPDGTDLDLVARSSALAQSLRESSLHDAFQWLRPWLPLSEYLPFVLPPNVSSLLDQNISTPLKTNTFGHHRHTGTGLVFYAQGARRSIGTCHPSTTCLLLPLLGLTFARCTSQTVNIRGRG